MEGQQLSVDLKKTHTIGFQTSQAILLDFAAPYNPNIIIIIIIIISQSKMAWGFPPTGVFCNFFPTGIYNDTQFWI